MTDDNNGVYVLDRTGQRVGTIERTYIDDAGAERMVAIKIGTLLVKHRLVPSDTRVVVDDGFQVPWTRDAIEASPTIDPGETLEGEDLEAVRQYYAAQEVMVEPDPDCPEVVTAIGELDHRHRPPSDFPALEETEAPLELGPVRDLGDVFEVPIVEEVLVKQRMVREVLRIRKAQLAENGAAPNANSLM